MKKILLSIVTILFVVGGAVAGDFLKNSGSEAAVEDGHKAKKKAAKKGGHDKKKDNHGKKDKKKKGKDHGKDKKGKGGHGDKSYNSGGSSYLKFKRQFVVPVMTQGKIDALVIMNLNLELNDEAPDNSYSLEPKLRDAITRELLALSNEGIFGKDFTSAENYETVRRTLMSASKTIMPEGIQDILILDIARQDQ